MIKKKVKKNTGFTLIELLVYIALATLLSLSIFSFVGSTRKQIDHMRRLSSEQITVALALDLIKRDLMTADMQRSSWDLLSGVFKTSIISFSGNKNNKNFRITQRSVGWHTVKHGLQRYEGEYDFTQRRWNKKSTSLYGCPITNLKFDIRSGNNNITEDIQDREDIEDIEDMKKTGPYVCLVIITYRLKNNNILHHDYVRLRNRVLL